MLRFLSCLNENRNLYTDVTLKHGNSRVNAHRIILASVSSYFRSLFQRDQWHPFDPTSSNSVINVDPAFCSETILHMLVDFSYTQTVPLEPETVCDLIVVADYYGFDAVVELATEYIIKQLSIKSCIKLWRFADNYNMLKLEEVAFDYILQNFAQVYQRNHDFMDLDEIRFNRIIISEWLNADDKEMNEASVKWQQKHRHIKEPTIEETMKRLRLKDEISSKYEKTPKININLLKQRITRRLCQASGDNLINQHTQRYPREVILAIGGWHQGSPTNHIEIFDLRSQKWSVITHLPDFVSETPRAYHSIVYADLHLYFVGGYDGTNYFDKVRRYHIITRKWEDCSRMYKKRCYVSAAYMDGAIFACGGLDGQNRLKCAERYEVKTNSWNQLPDMLQPRSDASCTAYNGGIYMCGGFSGESCLLSVECYKPTSHLPGWINITPMLSPRSGVVTVVNHGRLWALGGFNGVDRLKSTEYFDGEKWNTGPNMIRERSNFAGSTLNGKIIVCGGYNNNGTMKCVESLSFKMDGTILSWNEEETMNISRSALTSVVLTKLPKDRLQALLPRRQRPNKSCAIKQNQVNYPSLRSMLDSERNSALDHGEASV